MGIQRRELTPEYKDNAAKLVVDTARRVASVARELDLKDQMLGSVGETTPRLGTRLMRGHWRPRNGLSYCFCIKMFLIWNWIGRS